MRCTAYRGTAGEGRAAGAEATLQGVLVQVATAKRMPDARIVLTCQALGCAETLTLTLTPTLTPTKVALDFYVMRRALALVQRRFELGADVEQVVAVLDEVGRGGLLSP